MNAVRLLRYNPATALIGYLRLRCLGRVTFPPDRIGETRKMTSHGRFTTFRRIELLDSDGIPRNGRVEFHVVFHSSSLSVDTIIRRTDLTMPFFAGLSGFCNKSFMVNREAGMFSGWYEWDDMNAAVAYAESFAVRFMRRRSAPLPLSYWIVDKETGATIARESR